MDFELLHGVSPAVREKLIKAGFNQLRDLVGMNASDLAREAVCAPDEALAAIRAAAAVTGQSRPMQQPDNAGDRLARELSARKGLMTMSSALDDLLGGSGMPVGRATEICGAPGVGKTQLCMQLCVMACLPADIGGLAGEAIYIDTEGSFMPERALEMTRETLRDLGRAGDAVLESQVFSNIHYVRVHDHTEQIAAVNVLEDTLASGRVRLVILDSVAFHFRYDFKDMGLRTRLLNSMAQLLTAFARKHDIAVVLVNQMTTKVAGDGGGGSSSTDRVAFVPALGESWGHACATRVVLYWDAGVRHAFLYKSPVKSEAVVQYAVTMSGVRDVDTTNEDEERGGEERQDESLPPSKRARPM